VGLTEIRRKLGNGTENCVAKHYVDVIYGAVTSCYELGCWTYSMLWKAMEVKAALPMSTHKGGIMIIQEMGDEGQCLPSFGLYLHLEIQPPDTSHEAKQNDRH
jgi:hypothetical protein